MMTLLIAFLIGIAASTPLTAIDVVGNGRTDTIDCGGQNVRLGGSSNNITLKGTCPRLDVTGSNNTINVEALEAVDVTGVSNTIIWQRSLVGDQPRLGSTGLGNRLVPASDAAQAEPTPSPGFGLLPPVSIDVPSIGVTTFAASDGQELSIDCGEGNLVTVAGSDNRVTLTGTCTAVNLIGSANQVWVQRAHVIDVAGDLNAVVWENGPDDATPPTIVVIGTESTVEQGAMP
jgi:hypothetical protein